MIFSSTVFIVLVINEYLFDSYLPVYVVLPLTLLAYLFCGLDVVLDAVKMLIKQKRMTEQLLMTIATFAAFILKDFPEALAIMVFYKIGAKFEDFAKARSHSNIMHLASIQMLAMIMHSAGMERVMRHTAPMETVHSTSIQLMESLDFGLEQRILANISMRLAQA